MADIHDAHGGEVADAGAEAGAADAQLAGELALRGNAVSGLQFAGFDQAADVVDHPHGHVGVGFRYSRLDLRAAVRGHSVPHSEIYSTLRRICCKVQQKSR